MRLETLVESRATTLSLSEDQAGALRLAGRTLASDVTWWGEEDEDDEEPKARTVIDVTHLVDDRWRITVKDAIGLISIGDLQIEVQPKIPTSHFLYLLERAEEVPRLDEQVAEAEKGDAFWRLIARWYLSELQAVLRRDLVKDYHHLKEDLKLVRGRMDPLRTATAYYRGRIEFPCEFDDFNVDTPLNRTLKAAARKVSSISTLDTETRRGSVASLRRMEDVGQFTPRDLTATTARNTAHYRPALTLARHLLAGIGRLPQHGVTYARTFLIRTPRLIEKGILAVLRELLPEWDIRPRKLKLEPSHITVNPDLVFNNGYAVGDVKYKPFGSDWSRSDLYQNIAFATAFGTELGAVIGFATHAQSIPPAVRVGSTAITPLAWDVGAGISPSEAGFKLGRRVAAWLTEGRTTS